MGNIRGKRRKRKTTPKICRLCEAKVEYVDFLDADRLKKFQTEKGKILPRRITGTCLLHQKMLSAAIKRARVLSLVY
jgi:small subunit ribosomal protein S18